MRASRHAVVLLLLAACSAPCPDGPAAEAVELSRLGLGPCQCSDDLEHGEFDGEPVLGPAVRVASDELLLEDYHFTDSQGTLWIARAHTVTRPWAWNGSSIPWPFWAVFGKPKEGCHRYASVIHDYLYQRAVDHQHERKAVDLSYYDGVRAKGLGKARAKVMYWALRVFGSRNFQRPGHRFDGAWDLSLEDGETQLRAIQDVIRYVEGSDPTLEELDALTPARLAEALRSAP